MEREARAKAGQERAEAEAKLAARRQEQQRPGKKKGGRGPQIAGPEQAQPDAKGQRNFTDAESRIMPDGASKGSFVQGYNAPAAVDATAQGIVAAEDHRPSPTVAHAGPGGNQPGPQARGSRRRCRLLPPSQCYRAERGGDRFAHRHGTGQARGDYPHGQRAAAGRSFGEASAMRHKLRTGAGRAVYKMREAIVEPVFGQIKQQRGFQRFSLRGLSKVRCAWKLVCLASNLLKLYGWAWVPQAA